MRDENSSGLPHDENVVSMEVDMSVVEAQNRADFDIQIATANKYPRNLKKAMDNCIVAATFSPEIAKACRYSISRGGKTISGPSVHLAQLVASFYKNLRVASRVVRNDGKNIYSEGICFDLENNVAFKVEIPRKITDKYGKLFSEDMQTVTANAANAIAMRNAIFKVVPRVFTDRVLSEIETFLDGKLSDNAFFLKEKATIFSTLKNKYGVSEEKILAVINKPTVEAVDKEDVKTLAGILQSIIDGDSTPDQMFPMDNAEKGKAFEEHLKSKKNAEKQ